MKCPHCGEEYEEMEDEGMKVVKVEEVPEDKEKIIKEKMKELGKLLASVEDDEEIEEEENY